ncbi:MAG: aminotransferase class I/II-fold pyridoxal phosphate-dependent enzyme [Alphaproteobacteria bacterium]|nr:aminotransferase class I/II-fold pyridoxal phosphate-dependent enzyme [Alphaproteobacteria bacterium]
MKMHKNVRNSLKKLSLPIPIQKYFLSQNWDMDLGSNTNPFGGDFSNYPDVMQLDLKKLYLKRILSINPPPSFKAALDEDNVLFTAGSMEGIDLLLRAFPDPNQDLVCIPSPTFSAYAHWSIINGLQVKKIPLLGKNLNQIDVESIIKLNPKLLFICNPNNPIGTLISHAILKKLCQSLNGFVVIDEAYIEFSDQHSSLFYLKEYPNLIILRTFSKGWGLAGVRCGAVIAHKTIIDTLRYIQYPFSISIPSQQAVRKVLTTPDKVFETWKKIKKMRRDLHIQLSQRKNVIKIFESHTNFLMIALHNFEEVNRGLKQEKIHVLDCSSELLQSIRVSIGTEEQNQKFFEIIAK